MYLPKAPVKHRGTYVLKETLGVLLVMYGGENNPHKLMGGGAIMGLYTLYREIWGAGPMQQEIPWGHSV